MFKNIFIKENLTVYTVIFGLSLLAVMMHGYFFGVSDQEIFIPYIIKLNNPNFFGNDLLFTQSSYTSSVFYWVIANLNRFLSLQVIFIAGYFIFQSVFFHAVYRLALYLTKNKTMALASLLPFLLPKFIGGTANFTYDTFFGHRSVGTIFFIFYLTDLLKKNYIKAVLMASIGLWFHPLSIIPNIFLLPSLIISSKNIHKFKILVHTFLIFLLFTTPFIYLSKSNVLNNFSSLFDEQWFSIIKSRDKYLFISTWSMTGWAALGLYMVPLVIFIKNLDKYLRNTLKKVLIISLVVFITNAFILDVLKIPAIAQFQLVRSIMPIAYLGLILTSYLLYSKRFWQLVPGLFAFITLSINAFTTFLFLITIYFIFSIKTKLDTTNNLHSRLVLVALIATVTFYFIGSSGLNLGKIINRLQFPKEKSDWINVQSWAKLNTSTQDIFLVPPDTTGFRIFSERPIIGDIKDGAAVVYSPEFAKQWYSRMSKLAGYSSFDKQQFLNLRSELYFNYIVTKNSQILNFETVYRNPSFNVYKIDN
ncbi:MAG: hypothetical protein US19_C0028G0014 [Candidatus Daviesbacteria bacterium GW2011_GWB1_36_5]|uniref:DUF6798 domain-containing protein n=1 Tax=Candidatus Daviesbacteria bacterium GW2011_GWB1_36_5 TaxID=1618426 RepID=A0A0G0HWN7_9BACT|nr:MAG: hypothetical protein US19_C0028G0014 [Candidatus Daviesbacteria bacterium GW2011_GWB1_36_5]